MGLDGTFGDDDLSLNQLREEIQRQDAKFKELTHRVTNGYHAVAMRLRVQARSIKDPAARALCIKMAEHVEAMAMVHRHLYENRDSSLQELHEYLDLLCHDLSAAVVQKNISITEELESDVVVGTDSATTIGMVVAELITNAAKHAFGGRKGSIHICLRRVGDVAEISVTDNGHGLPDGFQLEGQAGLGMRLMLHQAKSLRGKLAFSSSATGATFTFSFPVKQYAVKEEPTLRSEIDKPSGSQPLGV